MNYTAKIKELIAASFPDEFIPGADDETLDDARGLVREEANKTILILFNDLIEKSNGRWHTDDLPVMRSSADIIFSRILEEIVSIEQAEKDFWHLFGGRVRDILRLKCLAITFNPLVFIDGKYIQRDSYIKTEEISDINRYIPHHLPRDFT